LVWLLGPAVVALAVPIWERRSLILANWPVLAAVVCLSLICARGSLVLLRGLLGDEVARALTLKSVVALDNFGEWSRHPLSAGQTD
jgi:putative effector of murein hydrolase